MDPQLGKSGDISGAVATDTDLSKFVSGLGAHVQYAYVRQDAQDDQHRLAAGLTLDRDIGPVAASILAQYARIMQNNADDIQSFLVRAHAKLKDKSWGVYGQFDRTDDSCLGEPVNTFEVGVDTDKQFGGVNAKLMAGVYIRESDSSQTSVGFGSSIILTAAKQINLYQHE